MPLPLRISTGTVSDKVLAKLNAASSTPYPSLDRADQASAILTRCLNYEADETWRERTTISAQARWEEANDSSRTISDYYREIYRNKPRPDDYAPRPFIPDANFLDDLVAIASHPSEKTARTLAKEHGHTLYLFAAGRQTITAPRAPMAQVDQLNSTLRTLWPILVERAKQDHVKYEYTMLMDDLYVAEQSALRTLELNTPRGSKAPTSPLALPEIDLTRTRAAVSATDPRDIFAALKAYRSDNIRRSLVEMSPSMTNTDSLIQLLRPKSPDDELLASMVESASLPDTSVALLYARIEANALTYCHSLSKTTRALSKLRPPAGYMARVAMYIDGAFVKKSLPHLVSSIPWPIPSLLTGEDLKYYDRAMAVLDQLPDVPLNCLLPSAYGERLVDILVKSTKVPQHKHLLSTVQPEQFASLSLEQYARLSAEAQGLTIDGRMILLNNLPVRPTVETSAARGI